MSIDVTAVEDGLDVIRDQGPEVVTRFYQRLFEMSPKLARRFSRTNMEAQSRRLAEVLVLLRHSAREPSKVLPALNSLGRRHTDLRIPPHEFLAVGYALVEAMGEAGGANWIERYGAAWTDMYRMVMDVMLNSLRAESQLRAENERRLAEEVDRLRQEQRMARLQDALRYGQHLRTCPALRSGVFRGPGRCECGWEALEAALREDARPDHPRG